MNNARPEQLEARIVADWTVLRPLGTGDPPAGILAHVRAAAVAETVRVRGLRRRRSFLRISLGLAASLAMIVCFAPPNARAPLLSGDHALASFEDWAEAFETTHAVIDHGWAAADSVDAERELGEWLDGLRESMEVGM